MADDLESLIKDIACAHRFPHAAMGAAMAHAKALARRRTNVTMH
jgi:hypothetical protein